ncbi:MAG: carbohydrate ABC transporter permease [Chitinivibrionales bacterium]|nr:carbohydrate ABC transporter permease [Chitinivibrionales bacterium]
MEQHSLFFENGYSNKNSPVQKIGRWALKSLLYTIFFVFVMLAVFPLIWLFYSSFKPLMEIIASQLSLPHHWTVENYVKAWKVGKLDIYFVNSIIYSIVSTAAVLIFGLMASFAFAKIPNRLTPFLYTSFIIGILLTIESILIPLFLAETKARLVNKHLGVILPYVGISLPLAIYLGMEYIKSIPDSLIESAKLEGASYLRIFFTIILPMTAPVATTIVILTVLSIWNEFFLVFILSSDDFTRSLPVGILSFSGPMATEFGMQFAALVIGLVPMLVFYFIFHKKITAGFAAGAVKG